MEHVIVLTHSKLDYDSRIRRQIRVLSKSYYVIVGCMRGDSDLSKQFPNTVTFIYFDPNITYIGRELFKAALSKKLALVHEIEQFSCRTNINMSLQRIYECYRPDYSYLYKMLYYYAISNSCKVKAIVANDVAILPIAYHLRCSLIASNPQVKLWGDIHEIHFDYSNDKESFNQVSRIWLVDTYLPKCNHMSSVSEWGVELYQKRFPKLKISCIRNVANYARLTPSVNSSCRLVFVGAAVEERRLDKLIDCLAILPEEYTLDFYVVTVTEKQQAYAKYLLQYASDLRVEKRIRILEPVKPEELIQTINAYDIGLFYIEPNISNYVYALPNKLFEYIQARLAVATTPVKSIKETIEKYNVGKVSDEYTVESFKEAIIEVRKQLAYYKIKSGEAAKELSAEKEWLPLLEYINQ